ncbi:hypothetical protein Tco_0673587 [Tanacetum coccineum]
MTSPYPTPLFTVPSSSGSSFSIPTTSKPVFSVATTEPFSSSNAKFPYLKKDEYETWAMKMEYWIMNTDHNLWNIVLQGNSRKRTGRDPRGNIMILPPVTVEEQIAVQREIKARTILLQSLPEDHMADFHHLDDAKDIWLAVKARFRGNEEFKGNDRFLEGAELRTLEIDVKGGSSYDSRVPAAPTHSAFISAASTNSKWSTTDSKGQPSTVNYTTTSSSVDVSGNVLENVLYSFVAENLRRRLVESSSLITKILPGLIKARSSAINVIVRDISIERSWKKEDSKDKGILNSRFKEKINQRRTKGKVSVDSMLNWSDHESEELEKGASEVYGMIAGYGDATIIPTGDAADDRDSFSADGVYVDVGVGVDGVYVAAGVVADGVSVAADVGADSVFVASSDATNAETEFALMGLSPQVQSCPFDCNHIYTVLKKEFDNLEVQYKECFLQVQAYKSSLQNLEQQKSWYQNNQLALEDKIRILTTDLGNTTNMLKYTEKLNEQAKLDNMNTKVKLEESEARFEKWMESSKNLYKLINSFISTRTKFGLGYGDTFGSDEVFDPSAPSIFDSTPEDVWNNNERLNNVVTQ